MIKLKRDDPTDHVNVYLNTLRSIDLQELKPGDWVESIGSLSIEAAGVFNQLGRFGCCIKQID